MTRPCPHCGGVIKTAAKICKHCRAGVALLAAATPIAPQVALAGHAGYAPQAVARPAPLAVPAPTLPAVHVPVEAPRPLPIQPQPPATAPTLPGRKDPTIAAILGFVLGPFGIAYVSVPTAAVAFGTMVVLMLTLGACTSGIAAPFIWAGYALWGYAAAVRHNASLRKAEHEALQRSAAELLSRDAPALAATGTTRAAPMGVDGGRACPACGTGLRAQARFCPGCGGAVT